jgi:predicted MFS family arabinose efflux permease
MSIIADLLTRFSNWIELRGYLVEISLAQIATVLVVYGGEMACYFRDLLKKNPFFIRVLGFILLNAFGIGVATVFGGRLLTRFYKEFSPVARMPVIFAVFLLIGIIAERKKHI